MRSKKKIAHTQCTIAEGVLQNKKEIRKQRAHPMPSTPRQSRMSSFVFFFFAWSYYVSISWLFELNHFQLTQLDFDIFHLDWLGRYLLFVYFVSFSLYFPLFATFYRHQSGKHSRRQSIHKRLNQRFKWVA